MFCFLEKDDTSSTIRKLNPGKVESGKNFGSQKEHIEYRYLNTKNQDSPKTFMIKTCVLN